MNRPHRASIAERVAVTASLLFSACSADADSPDSPANVEVAKSKLARNTAPSVSHVAALGTGNRAFAFDLFHQIASQNPDQNLIISPYSVSTALGMTYAGARTQTEAEMKSALHYDLAQPELHEAFNAVDLALSSRGAGNAGADGTPFRINVSNSLWAEREYPIETSFLDVLGAIR